MTVSAATSSSPRTDRVTPFYNDFPRYFCQVGGGVNADKMRVIAEIFHRILTPLYGSQDKAVQQIEESRDRRAFLLYDGPTPVGVLNFKTVLSDEFAAQEVTHSIEIKSLFVDQAAENSGKGLGSLLIDKLKEEVRLLALGENGIHVTVSEEKQESLQFFHKKGFRVVHTWPGRYLPGVNEHLLFCPTRIREHAVEHQAAAAAATASTRAVSQLFLTIPNAHFGDIHVLMKLADQTFISGSKDGSLHKWSEGGKLVRVVDEAQPTHNQKPHWITAAEVINNKYWVSGERGGRVFLWSTSGNYVKEIKMKLPPTSSDHVSHASNRQRVACLSRGLDPYNPSLLVGFPTLFDEYDLVAGRTESVNLAHGNDWIYCMKPLPGASNRMLVVCGASVDIWNKIHDSWQKEKNLMPEAARPKHHKGQWQRPFISSIHPLEGDPNRCALSDFHGHVKVLDILTSTLVQDWQEHRGKVWSVANIAAHLFASSGDDCTVKIWDVREPRSVVTISDHVGPVHSLLSLRESQLTVGTCPQNDPSGRGAAEIKFYDLRK